ncbi:hypothetical protein KA057_01435 [Candidatus Gracilibacteria bacterium]|nr:hypothetical protein [Candidatus Gracilibacteria bacterium]
MNLADKLLINYDHVEEKKTIWILDQGRHAVQLPGDPSKFRIAIEGLLSQDHLSGLLSQDIPLSKEKKRGRITTETTPYDDIIEILEESRALLNALREQLQPEKEEHVALAKDFRTLVCKQVNTIIEKFGPYHEEMREYTTQDTK